MTDHDTMRAVPEVAAAAAAHGLSVLPGIEITAVWEGVDVHVLGYFLDPDPPGLEPFLAAQRANRVARVRAIAARLVALGAPVDAEAIVRHAPAHTGKSIGRPQVAAALVSAGHVGSIRDAFDRWLAEGRPAFIPREGAPPTEVVEIVARAGGVSSLAHPGLLGRDEILPQLAAAGLGAVEAYHSEHDLETRARYVGLAARYGLALSGGSDYHGEANHRAAGLGSVTLPADAYARLRALVERAARRTARSASPPRPNG